jgi:hypothetical protein
LAFALKNNTKGSAFFIIVFGCGVISIISGITGFSIFGFFLIFGLIFCVK